MTDMGIKIGRHKIEYNGIAIALILMAEICFYTAETIQIYFALSFAGIILAVISNIGTFTFKVKKNSFILWVCSFYLLIFIYGYLFLQKGEFNGITLFYRLIESIALYLTINELLRENRYQIISAFLWVGIISGIYLLVKEGSSIIAGNIRIGDSLSGNVNTVGFNFGIIATLVMWEYCQNKRKIMMVLYVLFSAVMLLTGSKKAIIILIMSLILYFFYEKGRISGWLKFVFLLVVGIYLIFNVPYFYEIIGSRIESMIQTAIMGYSATNYSYSTEIRNEMLEEGLQIFKLHPLFGGGYNNFYANTKTIYDYSHCNYIEIMCTFGIFGIIVFYSKHLNIVVNLVESFKRKLDSTFDYRVLALILMIDCLVLDWAAVTFSAQCVWYLPLIFSCAAINRIHEIEIYGDQQI